MSATNDLINVLGAKYSGVVGDKPICLEDLLHSAGKASEALLYSILFMPELLVVGDSVLLAWNLPDKNSEKRFLEMLAQGDNSLESLEASFNFVEVGYLFDAPGRDSTVEEDELLADLISKAWRGWLMASFPNRKFKVEVLSEEDTGSTVGVHFFETR